MNLKLDALFDKWPKVGVSFSTEQEVLKAVENDGDALKYVKDQMFEHLLSPKKITLTKAEIADKFGIVGDFEIAE